MFTPPYTHPRNLHSALKQQGFALLPAEDVAALSGCSLSDLHSLDALWNDLAADAYLKDGGKYRQRRHASCMIEGSRIERVTHRAHWQPLAYNALHGGMERWFEPSQDALFLGAAPAVLTWISAVSDIVFEHSEDKKAQKWFTEVHQFRIDTAGGIGRPTPEGAHRDGVDLVAVFLIAREGIKGGETRVFEADGPFGQRFTLTQPWSVLLLDDARMIHETTPIQPASEQGGWRDTLVVTLRRGGFQDAA